MSDEAVSISDHFALIPNASLAFFLLDRPIFLLDFLKLLGCQLSLG
jgi:hypothetical protein